METDFEPVKLPEAVKVLYDALWQKIVWLHEDWSGYEELYGNQDTVALLNITATLFFARHQMIQQEYILLSISRLLDPASSGRDRTNLTLPALTEAMRETADDVAVGKINSDIDKLKQSVEAAITRRNKLIAHLDREVGLGQSELPDFKHSDISQAMSGIAAIMNAVDGHYRDTETSFDTSYMADDVKRLILHLKAARTLTKRERIDRAKKWTPLNDRDINAAT